MIFKLFITAVVAAAFAVGVAFVIALLGALAGWRYSVRVVNEDELRKAGL